MSKLYGPNGRPTQPQAQAAILAELAVGRTALRCLSAILAEREGRKLSIPKSRIEKVGEKYPGAVIRIGETLERITLRLMTPAELDAADAMVAEQGRARRALEDARPDTAGEKEAAGGVGD